MLLRVRGSFELARIEATGNRPFLCIDNGSDLLGGNVQRLTELILERSPTDVVTSGFIDLLLPGLSQVARQSLVKRTLASGELTRLKHGVYLLGPKYQRARPSLGVVSRHLRFPSYVSFESALAEHLVIPEAVFMLRAIWIPIPELYLANQPYK